MRADYGTVLPSAIACFEDDFEACIAHLRLPVTASPSTGTTNLLERLFVEERRRLKIIPNGFGEKPVLKLMFGVLVRAAERWRGSRFANHPFTQAIPAALFQHTPSLTPRGGARKNGRGLESVRRHLARKPAKFRKNPAASC